MKGHKDYIKCSKNSSPQVLKYNKTKFSILIYIYIIQKQNNNKKTKS